jgi:heterotetrameric sarcosine oxidase beta subunit
MVRAAPPPTSSAPLRAEVELAIVGGGIMGLALAYNLTQRGVTDVVVLEAHHLAWGASGRNGGGVRQQWSTEMNIRLMQESIDICAHFAQELGTNIWMRQGGYLFLAREAQLLARMEAVIALQNRCDVPTRVLSSAEVMSLVPELDVRAFAGAWYNPTDAIVFPWPFLWGYARAAARRGVEIHTFTPVRAIARRPDGAFLLDTPKGTVRAQRVVNAAGAWSPQVARLVGLELPTWPVRHEILSTEPLKPFLKPMVSVIDTGLYFSQSLRGEIVGGITLPEREEDRRARAIRLGSRLEFVEAMAAGLVEAMPRLGNVKVVRQWAGPYDLTPDNSPIVGEAPTVPGFFLCSGFVGHGFMMAPVVAKHYAVHLTGGPTHDLFHKWRLGRFAEGKLEHEDLIIG